MTCAVAGSPRHQFEEAMQNWTVKPIGVVRSSFSQPGQVPRGLGARHEEEGVLEIFPEFAAGLQDIEGFSHLFVLWVFDRSSGCELVGTPPCDTQPHGVFASRSPFRPNPIGLSVVRLLGREGNQLRVRGVDMLDGTPVLDIKPYLSSIPDSELRRGWLADAEIRQHDREL
jgi:tRNA-Thr(GGU) m(6)t(6)A37 methyltransferase TsaA